MAGSPRFLFGRRLSDSPSHRGFSPVYQRLLRRVTVSTVCRLPTRQTKPLKRLTVHSDSFSPGQSHGVIESFS